MTSRRAGGAALLLLVASACGQGHGEAAPPREDSPPERSGGLAGASPQPDPPGEAPDHAVGGGEALPRGETGLLDLGDGHALDTFLDALAEVDAGRPGRLARVIHMGDSSLSLDQLPHMLRSRFQERFGDGGPGFLHLMPHSPIYRNSVIDPWVGRDWDVCFVINRCREDGRYGLGGVTATSRGGSLTRFRSPSDGPLGRRLSRLSVWYAAQPRGGRLDVVVDGAAPVVIDTGSDADDDRFRDIEMTPGPHDIVVRAAGGPVRTYGVVLESPGPGVVWDDLSMIGAFTMRLLAHDPEHIAGQVGHRDADLLVLTYGGNDLRRLVSGAATAEQIGDELAQVIRLLRRGKPSMSCLITGITEHTRSGYHEVERHHVEAVIAAQHRAALAEGCAFFDTDQAMGGAGSYRRWQAMTPPLAAGDGKHLTGHGRDVIAQALYDAIMEAYAARRSASSEP